VRERRDLDRQKWDSGAARPGSNHRSTFVPKGHQKVAGGKPRSGAATGTADPIQRAPAGARERVLPPLRGRTFIAHRSGGRAAPRLATGYLRIRLRRMKGVLSIIDGAPRAVPASG